MEIRINISKKNLSKGLDHLEGRIWRLGKSYSALHETEFTPSLYIGAKNIINYAIFKDDEN